MFRSGSLGQEWEFNGSVCFGKEREKKITAANKSGLSQVMGIVGAYTGPLAVTDHLRLFLLLFSSSV